MNTKVIALPELPLCMGDRKFYPAVCSRPLVMQCNLATKSRELGYALT
jgi:hypothetical protein